MNEKFKTAVAAAARHARKCLAVLELAEQLDNRATVSVSEMSDTMADILTLAAECGVDTGPRRFQPGSIRLDPLRSCTAEYLDFAEECFLADPARCDDLLARLMDDLQDELCTPPDREGEFMAYRFTTHKQTGEWGYWTEEEGE